MKLLIIEPFYSGSHKTWADDFKKHSRHDVEILSLPGKFWKWRMYGAAYTLAESYINLTEKPDYIIATDMLDLSTFIALVRDHLSTTKVYLYFHENQLAYPWSENGDDKRLKRDIHYGFTNYTSALVADKVFFNSYHNMNSFYHQLEILLKAMPDERHKTLPLLLNKSSILPIGMNLKRLDQAVEQVYQNTLPLIVWNHRFEYDKNPQDFFKALFQLKDDGVQFKLALLGTIKKGAPDICFEALEVLKEEIVTYGFLTGDEYIAWLQAADIAPVTSYHDFFGISVMECIYANVHPILPRRLTYPDLYKSSEHPEIFYDSYEEFIQLLRRTILEFQKNSQSYRFLAEAYDWSRLISTYDKIF